MLNASISANPKQSVNGETPGFFMVDLTSCETTTSGNLYSCCCATYLPPNPCLDRAAIEARASVADAMSPQTNRAV
jgi:hypothetical protein